jgi:hypothetical protein
MRESEEGENREENSDDGVNNTRIKKRDRERKKGRKERKKETMERKETY